MKKNNYNNVIINAIWAIVIILLIIVVMNVFTNVLDDTILDWNLNKYSLGPGSVVDPTYNPPAQETCRDYDIGQEYRNAFGDANMDTLGANCLAIGGLPTETNREWSCYWDPAIHTIDCDERAWQILGGYCGLLEADWHCLPSKAYVGCECDKSLPDNWGIAPDQEEDDEGGSQEDYTGLGTIFVTKYKWTGASGGVYGADNKCQEQANLAGLPGSWSAIISDSSSRNAIDYLPASLPFYRIDGVKIADDKNDLFDGTINAKINLDQYGNLQTGYAWTGTSSDGKGFTDYATNCHNWGWVDEQGLVGNLDYLDHRWATWDQYDCTDGYRFYCVRLDINPA